jgi:hypothetical protein
MNDPGHQRPATLPDLIAALTALSDAGPVDRARAIPGLIEAAKGVLSAERAAAMAEAIAAGMNQAELARQLGIARQQISKTLAGLQINVLSRHGDGTWHLAGSFDYRTAERFHSASASPGTPQDLYRTIEGRWVLAIPLSIPAGNIVTHTYVTDDQARDWLRENGHEHALRRFASADS